MATEGKDTARSSDSPGSPEHERSGPTIDEAVAKADSGSQAEGVHIPSGEAASGESRAEQMPDVDGLTEDGRVEGDPDEAGTPPEPAPSPTEIGSGGAQRSTGARVSDRISAGEPVPDGPPFETDAERGTRDSSTGDS